MNNHTFDVFHSNSERPLSIFACCTPQEEHTNNYVIIIIIDDGFELRGVYHEQPNPEDSRSLRKVRNIETAHQLIFKSWQPDGPDKPKFY